MISMRIFKALVHMIDDGSLGECDVIEYQGRKWLVPSWIESPSEGLTMPKRIIPLDSFAHQEMAPGNPYGVDLVLNAPLPRELFDEEIPQELATRVGAVERPDISIRAGGGIH